MQTSFTCSNYSCLENKLCNKLLLIISITFYLFQLFTIQSIFTTIVLLGSGVVLHGSHVPFGVIICITAILALANALGYYLWAIVKSAYMQIKEENENVQPAGNYMMNTYEKSPPAQYNHRV